MQTTLTRIYRKQLRELKIEAARRGKSILALLTEIIENRRMSLMGTYNNLNKDVTFIYVLKDPRSGGVCYVGSSVNPKARVEEHIWEAKNRTSGVRSLKAEWINDLLKNSLRPQIEVIEMTERARGAERESYWILFYKKKNPQLLNRYILKAVRPDAKIHK